MKKEELIEEIKGIKYHNASKKAWIDRELVLDLVKQLDEPKKVTIPQFVAEWIEESGLKGWDLLASMCFVLNAKNKEVTKWFYLGENKNIFALAWINGYEIIEKEKRYRVRVKNTLTRQGTLNRNKRSKNFIFSDPEENSLYDTKFTRKELENVGFGWVFDCPGIEIEEVEG